MTYIPVGESFLARVSLIAKHCGNFACQSLSLNWIGLTFSRVTVIAFSRSLLNFAVARSVKKVSRMSVKISVNEIMLIKVRWPVSMSELPSSSSSSSEDSGKIPRLNWRDRPVV
jgi:hypothetical protein